MDELRTILAKVVYLPMVLFLILGALTSAVTAFFSATAVMLHKLSTNIEGEQDDV